MENHESEFALTTEQVREAIDQMIVQCELKMQDYEFVSARGCLNELGYHGESQDQIINAIAEAGFNYCLDPHISATHFDPNNPAAINDMVTDYPDEDACYWGPDQLKSRLHALMWRLPK
jgi:hypothetical protein